MAVNVSRNQRQDPLEDKRLEEPRVAEIIGLPLEVLQRMRRAGQGLPYLQLTPRRVVYNESDVRAYLLEKRREGQAS